MSGGWGRHIAGPAAVVAVAAMAGRATGQDEPGGWLITGDYGFSVEVNDNPTLDPESIGTDTIGEFSFGFQARKETSTSVLTFDIGGALRERRLDDEGLATGLVNPFAEFGYQSEGANSALSFDLAYRENDLDDLRFTEFGDDFTDDDLVVSGGELATTSVGFDYEIGISGPFGAEIEYDYFDREYSDTADPDLNDSTTQNVRLTTSFRPSEVLTLRAFVAQRDFDEDGGDTTDRTTRDAGFGLDYQIDSVWVFEGDFSYQEVEEDGFILGIPFQTKNDGFAYDVRLSREVDDGEYYVSLDQELSTFITQTTLRFGREMELASGQLSLEIGVTDPEFFDRELVGGIDWIYQLPRGQIAASYERTVVVNDDNELRKRDFVSLAYLHEINNLSSFSVDFGYGSSEALGLFAGQRDTNADLSLTYRHELTEDWDWSLAYRHRYREDSNGIDSTSNALIAGIDRRFSIRP